MSKRSDYIRVFSLILAVLALVAFVQVAGQMLWAAPVTQPGIKDPALATLETNEKLGQILDQLKTLNTKTQALHDLLKSGRVEIVVREAPPAPANGGAK